MAHTEKCRGCMYENACDYITCRIEDYQNQGVLQLLKQMIENGCSDSDIEDFTNEHPEIREKDIWDYVYEYNAPDGCKGCKFIQMSGMMPCIGCKRKVVLKDYYEAR